MEPLSRIASVSIQSEGAGKMGNATAVVIHERTVFTQSENSSLSAVIHPCPLTPDDQRFLCAGIDTITETRFIS